MSKDNGQAIHTGRLLPSNPDYIALCQAVEEKFKLLFNTYYNMIGEPLSVPVSLNDDMIRWRQMAVRHNRGDFRNSDAEIKSLRNIAEWTLVVNAKLHNQEKPNTMVWRDYD